tara:strand:- start:235 stop:429 length:195 start_codon:yes stop_codon:yes gene_type:complete
LKEAGKKSPKKSRLKRIEKTENPNLKLVNRKTSLLEKLQSRSWNLGSARTERNFARKEENKEDN